MASSLRIEFSGSFYHVTSRADGHEYIFIDDNNRKSFLAVLEQVYERFSWEYHSYCLMSNHYHLLIEMPEGNFVRG